jgi:CheY-like chemotaxis protein
MKLNISGPIILVDDDHDDHEIFKLVCTQLGVCDFFRHFLSGMELINYLEATTEKPFIILCDINMPMMNGIQVREKINSNEILRRKSIPFIFFSTSATDAQVQKAYDLTVQGFFLKGMTLQETEARFKKILEYWSECRYPNSRSN